MSYPHAMAAANSLVQAALNYQQAFQSAGHDMPASIQDYIAAQKDLMKACDAYRAAAAREHVQRSDEAPLYSAMDR